MIENEQQKTLILFTLLSSVNIAFYFAFPFIWDLLNSFLVISFLCLSLYLKSELKLLVITLVAWLCAVYQSNELYLFQPYILLAFIVFVICCLFKMSNLMRIMVGLLVIYMLKEEPQLVSIREIMTSLNYLIICLVTVLFIEHIKKHTVRRN